METAHGSALVLGMMSGTSLDGLDLACVEISWRRRELLPSSPSVPDTEWTYRFIQTQCLSYEQKWQSRLRSATDLSARELESLHREYGRYLGQQARQFLTAYGLAPDLIASHGHTVFHEPSDGYTLQIGGLEEIALETGVMVVGDFRSQDVARGGQGAPLVPIGDRLLFSEYDACINLGGFSNVSYEQDGERIAYDMGVCNLLLNQLSEMLPGGVDWGGEQARSGKVMAAMTDELQALDYYRAPAPKSLDRSWYEAHLWPIVARYQADYRREDLLATACHHIAWSLATHLALPQDAKILLTGGGALNDHLVQCIREQLSRYTIVIPDQQLINFKEALIFGLMGLLRLHLEPNVLASVTGACGDSCAGLICLP